MATLLRCCLPRSASDLVKPMERRTMGQTASLKKRGGGQSPPPMRQGVTWVAFFYLLAGSRTTKSRETAPQPKGSAVRTWGELIDVPWCSSYDSCVDCTLVGTPVRDQYSALIYFLVLRLIYALHSTASYTASPT